MSIIIDVMSKILKDNSGSLKFLHKKVKNWHDVLLVISGAKTEADIVFRNGERHHIKATGKHVITDYKGRKLRFAYGNSSEKLHSVLMVIGEFLDEPHSRLDVKDKDVIDIGAYIGDTPIYFALNGARHVYALEPYPYSCRRSEENVSANGLTGYITIINAACGDRKSAMRISEGYKNMAGSDLKSSRTGKIVPVLTLESLVNKYNLRNAALKIDCEGCEYGIILNAKSSVVRRFDSILIEYHYGYKDLEKRLKSIGFTVSHTKPERMRNANVKDKEMHGGTIFADLKR